MACSEEGKDLQQGAQISVKGQINNLKQKNSFKHHSQEKLCMGVFTKVITTLQLSLKINICIRSGLQVLTGR